MDNLDKLKISTQSFSTLSDIFHLNQSVSIIAGPCAIESNEQMEGIAKVLVENKVKFIRGGAYKPRTSPYSFQGMGVEGLKILNEKRKKYNLYAISEIMDPRDVEYGLLYLDIIQIGSRNMMNYSLLKEVGSVRHPVLLKRGMMATIEEFLYAAEYIVSYGNDQVILCERGIRTFDNSARNTLDVFCIAYVRQNTSLSIIADVSHSTGRKIATLPMAKAAIAAGAQGVMLEIHPCPKAALSDNDQQMDFDEFKQFLHGLSEHKDGF